MRWILPNTLLHASERLLAALQRVSKGYRAGGQAKPKPKQAATQRRDGDGAACPCPEGKMANPIRDIHQYAFIESLIIKAQLSINTHLSNYTLTTSSTTSPERRIILAILARLLSGYC
jgi:hypothetical protein